MILQITVDESTSARRRIPFTVEYSAANEKQRITVTDIGAGDSFTLTFSGQTTAAINQASDMSSDIDSKLEALSNIDTVTVTQVSATVYDVEFTGTNANADQALMTITPTGFSTATVAEIRKGGEDRYPATGLTIAVDGTELVVSKNGAAWATPAGTVTEVGNGLYYYTAAAAEVDTVGFLALALLRTDVLTSIPITQIIPNQTRRVVATGTAAAGAAGTITLAAGSSGTNDIYKYLGVDIISGTGAGQSRVIYGYVGATRVASIEPDWVTTPDTTSVYELVPWVPTQWDIPRANHNTTNTFGDVATLSDLPSGLMTSGVPLATDDEGRVYIAKARAQ